MIYMNLYRYFEKDNQPLVHTSYRSLCTYFVRSDNYTALKSPFSRYPMAPISLYRTVTLHS